MNASDASDLSGKGQFLVYASEDGQMKIDVRLENETVWLTQQQMADLFQTSKQNVGQHLKHIFEEGELAQNSVVKDFFTTAADGKNYKQDVVIAKNYLTEPELAALNNLVEQYLLFAEGQAMRRVPMHMRDWIAKLNAFLTVNDRDILEDAGKISHEMAQGLAEAEYDKFSLRRVAASDAAVSEFDKAVKKLPPSKGKKDRHV